jgi:hypothetical protein
MRCIGQVGAVKWEVNSIRADLRGCDPGGSKKGKNSKSSNLCKK